MQNTGIDSHTHTHMMLVYGVRACVRACVDRWNVKYALFVRYESVHAKCKPSNGSKLPISLCIDQVRLYSLRPSCTEGVSKGSRVNSKYSDKTGLVSLLMI